MPVPKRKSHAKLSSKQSPLLPPATTPNTVVNREEWLDAVSKGFVATGEFIESFSKHSGLMVTAFLVPLLTARISARQLIPPKEWLIKTRLGAFENCREMKDLRASINKAQNISWSA